VKILAVEDDAVARAMLLQALRRLGHEVVEASDGDSAWAMVESEHVRVVVSDWIMPRADGLDLCRRIRSRAGAEYIYFILLTSRDATAENQSAAADAGVDDFLLKPLNFVELWTRLRVAERILRYTTQVGNAADLFLLQKNPRRPQLLAATGKLHQRSDRQRLQPLGLPRLLRPRDRAAAAAAQSGKTSIPALPLD